MTRDPQESDDDYWLALSDHATTDKYREVMAGMLKRGELTTDDLMTMALAAAVEVRSPSKKLGFESAAEYDTDFQSAYGLLIDKVRAALKDEFDADIPSGWWTSLARAKANDRRIERLAQISKERAV